MAFVPIWFYGTDAIFIVEYLGMTRNILRAYFNLYGFLVIAIIGTFFKGGLLEPITNLLGVIGIYNLIKTRKNPENTRKQKIIGWSLALIWLFCFGITHTNG